MKKKMGRGIIGFLVCIVIFEAVSFGINASAVKLTNRLSTAQNRNMEIGTGVVPKNDVHLNFNENLSKRIIKESDIEIDDSIPTVILREPYKGDGFLAIAKDSNNNIVYMEENIHLDGIDALEYVYEQIYTH